MPPTALVQHIKHIQSLRSEPLGSLRELPLIGKPPLIREPPLRNQTNAKQIIPPTTA